MPTLQISPVNLATDTELSHSERFSEIRNRTVEICSCLQAEDMVVQPIVDVSPPKWHLAHTTWFFETFILNSLPGYKPFHSDFNFLFNSYYNTVGERVLRADRGNMSRPTTDEIYAYRRYVDAQITDYLDNDHATAEVIGNLQLGLQHEMQHQELLLTDIKYILGNNPMFPIYHDTCSIDLVESKENGFVSIDEGVYEVGFAGSGFCFDNEKGVHKTYIQGFEIATTQVSYGDFISFIEDGGYRDFKYWHADAWEWINQNEIKAPLYMHKVDGVWMHYTLSGFKPIDPALTLMHVSFYEAAAFAEWKGMRLPTEFEWEVASTKLQWGNVWEWTNSAYLPYPDYSKANGALGEYNGKFMINQMVLRGGSRATAQGHSRNTYRNFFQPHLQWQYAGIRLVK